MSNIKTWSADRVKVWVAVMGGKPKECSPLFSSITGFRLVKLSDADLQTLGIDDAETRQTILEHLDDECKKWGIDRPASVSPLPASAPPSTPPPASLITTQIEEIRKVVHSIQDAQEHSIDLQNQVIRATNHLIMN